VVARPMLVVIKVFLMVARYSLGGSEWLLGHWYVVSKWVLDGY